MYLCMKITFSEDYSPSAWCRQRRVCTNPMPPGRGYRTRRLRVSGRWAAAPPVLTTQSKNQTAVINPPAQRGDYGQNPPMAVALWRAMGDAVDCNRLKTRRQPKLGTSYNVAYYIGNVFKVHRHGDRTPINSFISMSNDPEAVEAATAPYGYGQLTDKGRRRGYQLGQYIKSRYCDLLSPKYNQSTVYFRSTDSTRAKMTVLTALAAIYPPTPDSWSDSIHWVPVPYTTLPARYDYNLGIINCPKLISGIYSLMLSPSTRLSAYDSVLNVLSEEVNYNLTVYNGMLYALYDLYISQKSLGIPLTDYVEENWDIITEAAGGAINLVFGNDNLIGLQAGTFLQEFFNVTDDILNGTETQRLRIYSAHDFNVYSLAEVSQITPSIGVPVYASSLALELRQVTETGQIVVLPVYVPSPGDEPEYRYIAGCGDSVLCDLETFRDITSPNLMDFSQWRTNCGYYDDMEIDVSTI